MPRPRRFGGTNTRCRKEKISWPPTTISPERGRSSPAIERKVVVFPQPLGPSSVKNLPCGTSKLTSCAARMVSPRSSRYSVHNPDTASKLCLLDSELAPDPLGEHHQDEQSEDEHHADRRKLDVLAVLPQ